MDAPKWAWIVYAVGAAGLLAVVLRKRLARLPVRRALRACWAFFQAPVGQRGTASQVSSARPCTRLIAIVLVFVASSTAFGLYAILTRDPDPEDRRKREPEVELATRITTEGRDPLLEVEAALTFDYSEPYAAEQAQGDLVVTNGPTGLTVTYPFRFEHAREAGTTFANALTGTALVGLTGLAGDFKFGMYQIELSVPLPDGRHPVGRDQICVPYMQEFDDPMPLAVRGDARNWRTEGSRLIGDIRDTGGWSEADLAPAFRTGRSFEIEGIARIGQLGDETGANGQETKQALGIVAGHLFTVLICDGFTDAVSILHGDEQAEPSAGHTDPKGASVRTGHFIVLGSDFHFRIRLELTADEDRVLVWIDGIRVRTRVVNMPEESGSWSPSLRVLGGVLEVEWIRVSDLGG